MPESDHEREDRAVQLAETRARRDTVVDNRLEGHDRRLASINGQLERGAKATELLAERILRMDKGLDELRHEWRTKQSIDTALRAAADKSLKQQVTRREFWLGVIVVVTAIVSVAINAKLI